MVSLNKIAIDTTLATEGVEHEFEIPGHESIFVTIAMIGTDEYNEYVEKMLRKGGFRASKLTLKQRTHAAKRAMARLCVKSWRNMTNDAGDEVPYSPEQCLAYFEDPALQEFYEWVSSIALEKANFQAAQSEAVAKNSRGASGGTSSSAESASGK